MAEQCKKLGPEDFTFLGDSIGSYSEMNSFHLLDKLSHKIPYIVDNAFGYSIILERELVSELAFVIISVVTIEDCSELFPFELNNSKSPKHRGSSAAINK